MSTRENRGPDLGTGWGYAIYGALVDLRAQPAADQIASLVAAFDQALDEALRDVADAYPFRSLSGGGAIVHERVREALTVAERLTREGADRGVRMAVGLGAGRVEIIRDVRDKNFIGHMINIAARLTSLEEAVGRVLASEKFVAKANEGLDYTRSGFFGEPREGRVKRTSLRYRQIVREGYAQPAQLRPVDRRAGAQPRMMHVIVYDLERFSELDDTGQARVAARLHEMVKETARGFDFNPEDDRPPWYEPAGDGGAMIFPASMHDRAHLFAQELARRGQAQELRMRVGIAYGQMVERRGEGVPVGPASQVAERASAAARVGGVCVNDEFWHALPDSARSGWGTEPVSDEPELLHIASSSRPIRSAAELPTDTEQAARRWMRRREHEVFNIGDDKDEIAMRRPMRFYAAPAVFNRETFERRARSRAKRIEAASKLLSWLNDGTAPGLDLTEHNAVVALLGDVGTGKTTLLDWIERELLKQASASQRGTMMCLPVRVNADKAYEGLRAELDVKTTLDRGIPWLGGSSADRERTWDLILRQRRVIVLLDGVDEAPDEKLRRSLVENWCSLITELGTAEDRLAGKHRLLIACRTDEFPKIERIARVELLPVDPKDLESYAERFQPGTWRRLQNLSQAWSPIVQDIWRTPIYFTLACRVAQRLDSPVSYATIDEFLTDLARLAIADAAERLGLDTASLWRLFPVIAVAEIGGARHLQISDAERQALLRSHLFRRARGQGDHSTRGDQLTFAHRTFLECAFRRALREHATEVRSPSPAIDAAVVSPEGIDVVKRLAKEDSCDRSGTIGSYLIDRWRRALVGQDVDPETRNDLLGSALEFVGRANDNERGILACADEVERAFDAATLKERVTTANWMLAHPCDPSRRLALSLWLGGQPSGTLRSLAIEALASRRSLWMPKQAHARELRRLVAVCLEKEVAHSGKSAARAMHKRAADTWRFGKSRRERKLGRAADALVCEIAFLRNNGIAAVRRHAMAWVLSAVGIATAVTIGALLVWDERVFGGLDCALEPYGLTGTFVREHLVAGCTSLAVLLCWPYLNVAADRWVLLFVRGVVRFYRRCWNKTRGLVSRVATYITPRRHEEEIADALRGEWRQVGDPTMGKEERLSIMGWADARARRLGLSDHRRRHVLQTFVDALRFRRVAIETVLAGASTITNRRPIEPGLAAWQREYPHALDLAYDVDVDVETEYSS